MNKKYYLLIVGFFGICIYFAAVYFFSNKMQLIHIPLTISSSGTPLVIAEIERTPLLLEIDLGSKFPVSLNENALNSIVNKKYHEVAKWRDAKGNFYEAPSYFIPSVKIGNLILNDIIVRQENRDNITNTTLWNDAKDEERLIHQKQGALGRPLLEKTNLLLDFQHLALFASNDKSQLQELGIFLENMTQVPFEAGPKGMIIQAETDVGPLRFILDTGSTITVVRSSFFQDRPCKKDARGFSFFSSLTFSMGGECFGSKNLFLYDIAQELHEIDGILGMDFLGNHLIYIDYPHRMLYIGNSR